MPVRFLAPGPRPLHPWWPGPLLPSPARMHVFAPAADEPERKQRPDDLTIYTVTVATFACLVVPIRGSEHAWNVPMMLANGTAMWKGLARVLNRLASGRAELKKKNACWNSGKNISLPGSPPLLGRLELEWQIRIADNYNCATGPSWTKTQGTRLTGELRRGLTRFRSSSVASSLTFAAACPTRSLSCPR